jgi:hypothetical protein
MLLVQKSPEQTAHCRQRFFLTEVAPEKSPRIFSHQSTPPDDTTNYLMDESNT